MRCLRILRCAAAFGNGGRLPSSTPPTTAAVPAAGVTASAAADGSSSSGAAHATLHAFRTRDITLRVPSKDHLVRVTFCSSGHLLAETIRRHNLLQLTAANLPFLQLLGTQLTFTNLIAAAQEGEERVETRFTGEEATIITEALALGECRCHLQAQYNAELEAQGHPSFPLRVQRVLYRQQAPFFSSVHADLEELLQMPSTQKVKSALAENAVPFSLYTPGLQTRVPVEAWLEFFAHNSTLHAYNYLRRSDGCVPAVWLHTALDGATLHAEGLLAADGTPTSLDTTAAAAAGAAGHPCGSKEELDEAEAQLQARRQLQSLWRAVTHSFGIVVTPLAAGDAVDQQVGQLNRALAEAAALLYAPSDPTNSAAPPVSPLDAMLRRCAEEHTSCQHLLSLVTGDYDGAHAAAVAARQYSTDPAAVAAVVDPLRRLLSVQDIVIPLAATEAVRTGLDFFCRCSKANVMESLRAAPAAVLESLKDGDSVVKCSFCGKQHFVTDEEWGELGKTRAAGPPAQ